jgi:hypothetical protein
MMSTLGPPSAGGNRSDTFQSHLLERFHHGAHAEEGNSPVKGMAPWQHPSSCAILLEFRPVKARLEWSIRNAMDNLPVSWCIQVAGSPEVLQSVNASFPVEVAIGKIRFLDLGDGAGMTQVWYEAYLLDLGVEEDASSSIIHFSFSTSPQEMISTVFADRGFYERLMGDTWLFFQVRAMTASMIFFLGLRISYLILFV